MRPATTLTLAFAASAVALFPAPRAAAQDDAPAAAATASPAADSKLSDAVQLFAHNVLIAKPDQAAGYADLLLADEVLAKDLAIVVDTLNLTDRMDQAFRRARSMAGVSEQAGRLEVKLEQGRRELARDHERIANSVAMLTGPVRGQLLAKDRLLAAGEYAVPALLLTIVDGRNAALEVAATRVLVDLKRQAAMPLAVALPELDPVAQRKVAVILGEIGYPIAVPALLELAQSKSVTPDVADAATAAVRAIGSRERTAAAAYAEAAAQFLLGDPSLMAYADALEQNVWNWSQSGGLGARQVASSLYFDVMAMMFAQHALELDPSNRQALALFIAADLRRESRLNDSLAEPIYGKGDRSAQYFATLAGPTIMQDVLALGLNLTDTGLIRAALGALRETAGAEAMIGTGNTPVVQSLLYPDRRVQFEAALTLASVTPATSYSGAEQVVPTLAEAVRSGGQLFGGIIAPSTEDAQRFAATLQGAGYVPLTAVKDAAGFDVVASRNAGADLVVVAGSGNSIREAFATVRNRRGGMTLPILVVAQPADKGGLQALEKDGRTLVIGAEVSDEAFAAGVSQLMARAYGAAPTPEDMSRFAPASLDALLRIALQGGSIYKIADGERGLVEALRTQEGGVRVTVAQVLALVPTDAAQRALIETALQASGDEQAMLLGPVATSARRWGSHASQQQADALRAVVVAATGTLAEAASAAYGALSLPADQAVEMILKARKPNGAPAGDEGTASSAPASQTGRELAGGTPAGR